MNFYFKYLGLIMVLLLMQSCAEEDSKDEIITDPFTYATKFNWHEDSIKIGASDWIKIDKGKVFAWLSPGGALSDARFAIYNDRTNINTDFAYTIREDSVFAFKVSSDTIYFLDGDKDYRTDIQGRVTFSPDTLLIMQNTAVSPDISIKYRLEK